MDIMINKANIAPVSYHFDAKPRNLKTSDISNKHLSPKTNRTKPQKTQNSSPKLSPTHSKTFISQSKHTSKVPKRNSKYNSPIRETLIKTTHPSENSQSDFKLDSHISKVPIPFKHAISNHPKDKNYKSPTKRKKTPKKLSFDPQIFFSHLKTKTFPIKFSALTQSDLTLIKSFTTEYSQIVNKVDLSFSGLLNYSSFCQVLNKLRLISSPICKSEEETNLVLRSWKILGGLLHQKVPTKDLHLFLLSILGIPFHLHPTTPITKKKVTLWSLSQREINAIHSDFSQLLASRNAPAMYEHKKDSSSEEISGSDSEAFNLEIVNGLREILKKADMQYSSLNDFDLDKGSKFVQKASLRDVNSSPSGINKAGTNGSGFSGNTSKNLSLNTSESEEGAKVCALLTPCEKGDGKMGLGKVCVEKVGREMGKVELNSTVSYIKASSKKLLYACPENKLCDSMLCEGNLLNISEMPFVSKNSIPRLDQKVNPLVSDKKQFKLNPETF